LTSWPRVLGVHALPPAESDMTRNVKDELEWQRLDLELDRDLEATFPASDALKITRRQPDTSAKTEQPKIKED
jgi:hypothetical protein